MDILKTVLANLGFMSNPPSICSTPKLIDIANDYKYGHISVERCLLDIITYMSMDGLRIHENGSVLKILDNFLATAVWQQGRVAYHPDDYNPTNPTPWINNLYTSPVPDTENDALHLNQNKTFLLNHIAAGTLTPIELINAITADWYILYKYKHTYEALKYCISASSGHIVTDKVTTDIDAMASLLSYVYAHRNGY